MSYQHRLFLGDFNDFFGNMEADPETGESAKQLNFLLFVLLTILEPLIMLNLLIALVSMVYTELTASNTNNDYASKNRMILEFETIQVWNRESDQRNKHLVTAQRDDTLFTQPSKRNQHSTVRKTNSA
jgi:hypothetical protein